MKKILITFTLSTFLSSPAIAQISVPDNVKPILSYTGNMLGSVNGREDAYSTYSHEIDFGAEVNFGDKWNLTAIGAWTYGDSLSDEAIGDLSGVQGTFNGGDHVWLYQLMLTKDYGQGSFGFGRMAVTDTFISVDSYDYFVNSSFSSNGGAVTTNDGGISSGPTSGWGAYGIYKFQENIEIKLGSYLSNQENFEETDNGLDWSFDPNNGVVTFIEGTYGITNATNVGLGGYYDTAEFEEFNGNIDEDNEGVYGWIESALTDKLTGSLMIQFAPEDDKNIFPLFGIGTLIYKGLLENRPDDVAAIGFYYGDISSEASVSANSESMIEANYSIALTDNITVQPDAQYIINPGGADDDVWVLGIQVGWEF